MKIRKNHVTRLERKTILVLVSFLLFALPVLSANAMPSGKKLNLSGTWILNEQKSDFGEYGRMMASDKLIIVHKKKNLTFERFATAPTGEAYNYTENYTIDGKECVNPLFEESKKTSTVSRTEDKKGLVINSTLDLFFEGQEMKILTVENFTLEEGGKIMVIKATASTDYGDMTVKFVYDLE
jgi:hypothetical protein